MTKLEIQQNSVGSIPLYQTCSKVDITDASMMGVMRMGITRMGITMMGIMRMGITRMGITRMGIMTLHVQLLIPRTQKNHKETLTLVFVELLYNAKFSDINYLSFNH